MGRKTSSLPTRIYTYDALPPTENADLFWQHLRAAHAYTNKLIEIEQRRRAIVEALMQSHGEVARLAPRIEALSKEREELFAAVSARRKEARKRIQPEPAERDRIKELTAQLKTAWAELKSARAEARVALAEPIAKAWEEANAAVRAARANSGVHWGTYLLVERAVDQAKKSPREIKFRRWSGGGRVGVQVQKSKPAGTQVQIDPVPADAWTSRPKRRASYVTTNVRLRLGTDDNRQPIWATLPVVVHRPLPSDAMMKWAWIRVRPGWTPQYQLQISLESHTFVPPAKPVSRKMVALDIGWRLRPERSLRVGYVADEEGDHDEIALPAQIASHLTHAEELQSRRDQSFNAACAELMAWVADREVPGWLGDELANVGQWRSTARLGRIVLRWRNERFKGDADMFERLWQWRGRNEVHLREWQLCEHAKALRARKDFYRRTAAELARRYGTLVIEDFDLREVARRPATAASGQPQASRHQRRHAAPGDLRQAMVAAFLSRGGSVIKVSGHETTQKCHRCGHGAKWDALRNVEHTCEGCGETWDQDQNAAFNILALGREQTAGAREPARTRAGQRTT
jgi:hypothetical protein